MDSIYTPFVIAFIVILGGLSFWGMIAHFRRTWRQK
jgi:hypothetical protein